MTTTDMELPAMTSDNINVFVSTTTEATENSRDHNTARDAFQMSLGSDIAWTIVFGLMITGAIVGNLVVLWIILGRHGKAEKMFKQ